MLKMAPPRVGVERLPRHPIVRASLAGRPVVLSHGVRFRAAHGKEIRAAAVAPAAAPNLPAPVATPASASADKVQIQVTSTPAAAEIEIDGSFIGSTPTTVGVAAGQHQISVKKSGFKPWERKIAVSNGRVNVNAVLEPDLK
jgi:hypothetical protein